MKQLKRVQPSLGKLPQGGPLRLSSKQTISPTCAVYFSRPRFFIIAESMFLWCLCQLMPQVSYFLRTCRSDGVKDVVCRSVCLFMYVSHSLSPLGSFITYLITVLNTAELGDGIQRSITQPELNEFMTWNEVGDFGRQGFCLILLFIFIFFYYLFMFPVATNKRIGLFEETSIYL